MRSWCPIRRRVPYAGGKPDVAAHQGFSLVEVMVSILILSTAATTLLFSSNIASLGTQRARALADVQEIVSRDLNWMRWYGKAWRCARGSYSTCTTQSASGILSYQSASCASLVPDFLNSASVVSTQPARPFPVPNALPSQQIIASVNGFDLVRSIRLPTSTSQSFLPQSIVITYFYAGQTAFNKTSSVLLSAGSWCSA
jgi:prepilin-type N-terminal cleavage/methylation domain-containing protein